LRHREGATITEIYNNVSFSYYHNASKHLGALLSRMVYAGKITRLKKGLFFIKPTTKAKEQFDDTKQQLKLF